MGSGVSLQDRQAVIDSFAGHVSPGKVEFFRQSGIDFVFGERKGAFVWDLDGSRRLIDCHVNGGVFNLGHRNPELIETLRQALEKWDIGNHHFISEPRARLARRLAELAPGNLRHTVFAVGGGEAVDLGIKVARRATGRRRIVSAKGGFHGHTGLALAAGDAKYSAPFLSQSEDFVQVPFNDLAALASAVDETTAAVILEPIPATLGMPLPDGDYLPQVAELCRAKGTVLIADEIQTGLGRTGRVWCSQHYNLEPDILITGKGLSGGLYPMAATLITPELEAVFHEDPFIHISTFGGAEVGCAVADRVLDLTASEGFLANVESVAGVFESGLASLAERAGPFMTGFRQKGLMIALQTADPKLGPLMSRACFEAGLLCVFAGNDPSAVQFLPPLIIDAALAEEILERLGRAIEIAAQLADRLG